MQVAKRVPAREQHQNLAKNAENVDFEGDDAFSSPSINDNDDGNGLDDTDGNGGDLGHVHEGRLAPENASSGRDVTDTPITGIVEVNSGLQEPYTLGATKIQACH